MRGNAVVHESQRLEIIAITDALHASRQQVLGFSKQSTVPSGAASIASSVAAFRGIGGKNLVGIQGKDYFRPRTELAGGLDQQNLSFRFVEFGAGVVDQFHFFKTAQISGLPSEES